MCLFALGHLGTSALHASLLVARDVFIRFYSFKLLPIPLCRFSTHRNFIPHSLLGILWARKINREKQMKQFLNCLVSALSSVT